MPFDTLPTRCSNRLPSFDYRSPLTYFLTICTNRRERCLGEVRQSTAHLSLLGKMVADEWLRTPLVRPGVVLDEWIIMPDHVHGILTLPASDFNDKSEQGDDSLQSPLGYRPRSLASLVGGFKAACSRRFQEMLGDRRDSLWQRNYYEAIIRSEERLEVVRKYIQENPVRLALKRRQA